MDETNITKEQECWHSFSVWIVFEMAFTMKVMSRNVWGSLFFNIVHLGEWRGSINHSAIATLWTDKYAVYVLPRNFCNGWYYLYNVTPNFSATLKHTRVLSRRDGNLELIERRDVTFQCYVVSERGKVSETSGFIDTRWHFYESEETEECH